MFLDFGLQEQHALIRVESDGQEISNQADRIIFQVLRIGVAGGQGMPVGDEEIAIILVLQAHPVIEGSEIVAEMDISGRTGTA